MASKIATSDDKRINYAVTELEGCTEVRVEKGTYLWTIKNYSFCGPYCVKSPKFIIGYDKNKQWHINLKRSENYVSLSATITKKGGTYNWVDAKLKMSIISNTGQKSHQHEFKTAETFFPGSSRGFEDFITLSSLHDKANGLIFEDKLRIFCEIGIVIDHIKISGPSSMSMNEPECKLIENFENLLRNSEFSDVTFVVGGEELSAHKGILASRSDVFAAMFRHQMEEQKLNRVTIMDIEPDVFKEMLQFIYTGKAPNINKIAGDLLAAADKYALEKLKVMCAKALCFQLTTKTAAGILTIAHLHNANQLRAKTLHFIRTYSTEVTKTKEWKNLITKYPDLIPLAF